MKILLFGLYSAVWPHALLEAQIIKGIKNNSNIEVYYLKCDQSLQGLCIPKQYLGLDASSPREIMKEACKKCTKNSDRIVEAIKPEVLNLGSYLDEDDIKKSYSLVKGLNSVELEHFEINGISVGKYALYDAVIKFKKNSGKFALNEANFLRDTIQNSILGVTAASKILLEIKPDVVLCTDVEYGVTRSFAEVALRSGVDVYRMSNTAAVSEKMKTTRVYSWGKFGLTDPALIYWPTFKRELNRSEERRVTDLIRASKTGKSPWTYSTASAEKSPRHEFGIPKEHKIILAVLNSTDEYLAAVESGNFPRSKLSGKVFKDQTEWVMFLLAFVAELPEVTLVIRPHPRDYANKREGLNSEQSKVWDDIFRFLPNRVVIDDPSRRFPLPDYWEHISVLTTGWSSTALDAVFEGVPAVTYDKNLPLYPHSLIVSGESIIEYKRNLTAALNSQVYPEQKSDVIRWLWLSNFGGAFKLRGGILENSIIARNKPVRVIFLLILRGLPNIMKKIELKRTVEPIEAETLTRMLTAKKVTRYEIEESL